MRDTDPFRVCSCCHNILVVDCGENDFVCEECGERLCPECNDEHRLADEDQTVCPFCIGRIATDAQLLAVACDLLDATRDDLAAERRDRIAHPPKEKKYVVYDPEQDVILTETPLSYDDAKGIADELDDVLIIEWRN